MLNKKPIKAKPSYYAYCFFGLKEIALEYGYNLVLHGSLDRDLDLIAIPWQEKIGDSVEMIKQFAEYLNGKLQHYSYDENMNKVYHTMLHQGRKSYVIDLNRGGSFNNWEDVEYYVDISVTPTINYL